MNNITNVLQLQLIKEICPIIKREFDENQGGFYQAQEVASNKNELEKNDIMVIYGENKDIKKLLND